MRRLTRLTPAFSKKLANLESAVAFHYARYNFVLRSRTLGTTPAVKAAITEQPWPMERLVNDALALVPLSPGVNGHTARGAN